MNLKEILHQHMAEARNEAILRAHAEEWIERILKHRLIRAAKEGRDRVCIKLDENFITREHCIICEKLREEGLYAQINGDMTDADTYWLSVQW